MLRLFAAAHAAADSTTLSPTHGAYVARQGVVIQKQNASSAKLTMWGLEGTQCALRGAVSKTLSQRAGRQCLTSSALWQCALPPLLGSPHQRPACGRGRRRWGHHPWGHIPGGVVGVWWGRRGGGGCMSARMCVTHSVRTGRLCVVAQMPGCSSKRTACIQSAIEQNRRMHLQRWITVRGGLAVLRSIQGFIAAYLVALAVCHNALFCLPYC